MDVIRLQRDGAIDGLRSAVVTLPWVMNRLLASGREVREQPILMNAHCPVSCDRERFGPVRKSSDGLVPGNAALGDFVLLRRSNDYRPIAANGDR